MLTYGATHISLELIYTEVKLGPGSPATLALTKSGSILAACLLAGLAVVGGMWRVVMGRHTVKQVATGWVTGFAGGLAWWTLQHKLRFEPVDIDAEIDILVGSRPVLFRVGAIGCVAGASFLLKRYSDLITMGSRAKKQ